MKYGDMVEIVPIGSTGYRAVESFGNTVRVLALKEKYIWVDNGLGYGEALGVDLNHARFILKGSDLDLLRNS